MSGHPIAIAIPLIIAINFLKLLQYVATNSPFGSSNSSHLAQASKYSNKECVFVYPILHPTFLKSSTLIIIPYPFHFVKITYSRRKIKTEKATCCVTFFVLAPPVGAWPLRYARLRRPTLLARRIPQLTPRSSSGCPTGFCLSSIGSRCSNSIERKQTTQGGLFSFVVHLQGFEPGTH